MRWATWLILFTPKLALAETPLAWKLDHFGENQSVAGHNGWVNGYSADTWWGAGGRAYSATDHNVSDSVGTGYGSGWAADNWIARGDHVGQGVTSVSLYNEDDDAIGLVACSNMDDTFYLVGHSRDSTPPGVGAIEQPTLFVMRVEAGEPDLLETTQVGLRYDQFNELSLTIDDGALTVELNGTEVLEVVDPDPLLPGRSGLYAYDAGHDGGSQNTDAFFDAIEVRWMDEDGDSVPDDTDNCEGRPNKDQADDDDDGIGNACDADFEGPDDTGGDDTDDGVDPGDLDEGITAAGCSCAAPTGAPTLSGVLLAALWLGRRRRSRRPPRG